MKRKLSVLISAVFALSCAYVPNAIYAEDNETASMWKYASYSFGETPEEYKNRINKLAQGHTAEESSVWGREFVEEANRTGHGLRREFIITDKNM